MESEIKKEDALKVLGAHKDGRKLRVHTFESFGPILMGCDMDLSEIKTLIKGAKEDEIQIAGPNMRGLNHGIAIFRSGRGWLFISTQPWFSKITRLK